MSKIIAVNPEYLSLGKKKKKPKKKTEKKNDDKTEHAKKDYGVT